MTGFNYILLIIMIGCYGIMSIIEHRYIMREVKVSQELCILAYEGVVNNAQ